MSKASSTLEQLTKLQAQGLDNLTQEIYRFITSLSELDLNPEEQQEIALTLFSPQDQGQFELAVETYMDFLSEESSKSSTYHLTKLCFESLDSTEGFKILQKLLRSNSSCLTTSLKWAPQLFQKKFLLEVIKDISTLDTVSVRERNIVVNILKILPDLNPTIQLDVARKFIELAIISTSFSNFSNHIKKTKECFYLAAKTMLLEIEGIEISHHGVVTMNHSIVKQTELELSKITDIIVFSSPQIRSSFNESFSNLLKLEHDTELNEKLMYMTLWYLDRLFVVYEENESALPLLLQLIKLREVSNFIIETSSLGSVLDIMPPLDQQSFLSKLADNLTESNIKFGRRTQEKIISEMFFHVDSLSPDALHWLLSNKINGTVFSNHLIPKLLKYEEAAFWKRVKTISTKLFDHPKLLKEFLSPDVTLKVAKLYTDGIISADDYLNVIHEAGIDQVIDASLTVPIDKDCNPLIRDLFKLIITSKEIINSGKLEIFAKNLQKALDLDESGMIELVLKNYIFLQGNIFFLPLVGQDSGSFNRHDQTVKIVVEEDSDYVDTLDTFVHEGVHKVLFNMLDNDCNPYPKKDFSKVKSQLDEIEYQINIECPSHDIIDYPAERHHLEMPAFFMGEYAAKLVYSARDNGITAIKALSDFMWKYCVPNSKKAWALLESNSAIQILKNNGYSDQNIENIISTTPPKFISNVLNDIVDKGLSPECINYIDHLSVTSTGEIAYGF